MKYLFFFLLPCIIGCSQSNINEHHYEGTQFCNVEVSIDYFGIISKITKVPDTLNIKIKRNIFCKAEILSCSGDMQIYALDSNQRIVLKGAYIASQDTIIDTSYIENPETGEKKTETTKYLNPKREGEWIYYDTNGNIEKKELYKNGELVSVVHGITR